MFGSLGFTEIAFILVLALLLFGPKRLPEIGRTIGKGLAEFRRASNDLKRTLESEVALDEAEQKRRPSPVPPAAPAAKPTETTASAATTGSTPADAEPSADPNGETEAPHSPRAIERTD